MAARAGVYGITDRVLTIANAAQLCDVHVEQRPDESATDESDGTYRRLWPAAIVFCRYLCANPDLVRGKRVVELGAGGGLVGLVCAALGASHVCITDVPGALPQLEANLQRNPSLHSSGLVSVAPCTWGESAHTDALLAGGGRFDVVLSCEVIYKQDEEVLLALLETQDVLLATGPHALNLLIYEFRNNMVDDFAYFGPAGDRFDPEVIPLTEYEGELRDPHAEDDDARLLYRYSRLADAAAEVEA